MGLKCAKMPPAPLPELPDELIEIIMHDWYVALWQRMHKRRATKTGHLAVLNASIRFGVDAWEEDWGYEWLKWRTGHGSAESIVCEEDDPSAGPFFSLTLQRWEWIKQLQLALAKKPLDFWTPATSEDPFNREREIVRQVFAPFTNAHALH